MAKRLWLYSYLYISWSPRLPPTSFDSSTQIIMSKVIVWDPEVHKLFVLGAEDVQNCKHRLSWSLWPTNLSVFAASYFRRAERDLPRWGRRYDVYLRGDSVDFASPPASPTIHGASRQSSNNLNPDARVSSPEPNDDAKFSEFIGTVKLGSLPKSTTIRRGLGLVDSRLYVKSSCK
jgi:hypothetical protein